MSYNLRSRKRMEAEVPVVAVPPPVSELPVEESPEENVVESRNRALGNEYILAEVMSYLAVKDLRACRRVNTLWTQVATRVMAPKAPVVKLDKSTDLSRVENFMKVMGPAQDLPCRKFSLDTDLLQNASPEKQFLLRNFIEKVAPVVIQLDICSFSNRLFPRGKPKKRTKYSKLRSLTLDIQLTVNGQGFAALKSNLDYMITILENSPILDTLSVYVETYRYYGDAEFLRVMQHAPWNNIAHLKLNFRLLDEHFQKIMELGADMKLKSFEMATSSDWTRDDDTRPRPGEGTGFPLFLDRQSRSLESLKLHFDRFVKPQSNFRWPTFPKLKVLKIGVVDDFEDMFRLSQLSFSSQQFPILSFVTVSGTDFFELDSFFHSDGMAPLETVKKLRLDSFITAVGGEADARRVIGHLAKLFPCVKNLGVPADSNIMKAIEAEEAWKDMKSLTLLCGRNDEDVDSALTGYSPEKCERISKFKPQTVKFQEEERKMESRIFKFLHNLETLELGSDTLENYWKFSSLSCRLVLLKLKNLKKLILCRVSRRLDYQHMTLKVPKPVIQEMSNKFKVLYTDLFDDVED